MGNRLNHKASLLDDFSPEHQTICASSNTNNSSEVKCIQDKKRKTLLNYIDTNRFRKKKFNESQLTCDSSQGQQANNIETPTLVVDPTCIRPHLSETSHDVISVELDMNDLTSAHVPVGRIDTSDLNRTMSLHGISAESDNDSEVFPHMPTSKSHSNFKTNGISNIASLGLNRVRKSFRSLRLRGHPLNQRGGVGGKANDMESLHCQDKTKQTVSQRLRNNFLSSRNPKTQVKAANKFDYACLNENRSPLVSEDLST